MADFFGMNVDLAGLAGGFGDLVTYTVLMLGAVIVLWGCLYLLSFKYPVRVYQETASGRVYTDTKAREFTKNGIKRWRLLKFSWIKNSYFAPPTNYLQMSGKGKLGAEADLARDGTITWRLRSGNPDVSDAFTGEERALAGAQAVRAAEYRKQSGMAQLMQNAPMILVVMILVIVLAFYGEITKPLIQAQEAANGQCTQMAESCNALAHTVAFCTGQAVTTPVGLDDRGNPVPPPPN